MLERTPGIRARCLCMDDDDVGRAACNQLKAPATWASLVVRPPKSAAVYGLERGPPAGSRGEDRYKVKRDEEGAVSAKGRPHLFAEPRVGS